MEGGILENVLNYKAELLIDKSKKKHPDRLEIWCSIGKGDMGGYSIEGANAAKTML